MKNKADNKKGTSWPIVKSNHSLKQQIPGLMQHVIIVWLCFVYSWFRASEICRLRISDIDLKAKCIYIHRLKRLFNNAPAIEQRSSGSKNWLSIRTRTRMLRASGYFYRVRGIRFLGNSFTILSRLPVVMPGCHWRFIRTCYAIRVVLLWRIWE